MPEISPLHRVIDAGRWEAERLLGRLIVIVHAAFLDTGFVSHPHAVPPKSGRVPRRVGATASTLSLRYAAPGLRDAVVLRMSAHGMRVVFYVRVRSDQGRGPGLHWVCVDARAAAPLLSGGLDDTARALTSHGACGRGLAAPWRELTEKLCRGALVDLRRANAFVLLPGDIMLEILARLVYGLDLLRVASTCAELRRLVADHDRELWKHRLSSACGCGDGSMSWMERWCCCCCKHTRSAKGIGLSSMKEDYRKYLEGLDQSILAQLYRRTSQSTDT